MLACIDLVLCSGVARGGGGGGGGGGHGGHGMAPPQTFGGEFSN